MYKGIVFDLDGTLLDTLRDIRGSINRILEKDGYPIHSLEEYHKFVGSGIYHLCEAALPSEGRYDSNVRRYIELFREDYSNHWHDETIPYEGIKKTLALLQEMKIELGVLSNKPEYFIEPMLKHFFPEIKFFYAQGNVPELPAKPEKESAAYLMKALKYNPADYLFVGDSDIDIYTGHNIGMKSIGVSWGFRTVSELEEAGADWIIDKADEIIEIINMS